MHQNRLVSGSGALYQTQMKQVTDLDLRLLRVFMAVVESGGFVGAQSRLNHAPSTLSEQIKDLEYRVGFTVCLRGRRGFKMTEQGERLYDAARELLEDLEVFRNKVSEISGRTAGALNLGMVDNTITETQLPIAKALRHFKQSHPDVQVNINIQPPPELESALLEGLIDLAVGPFAAPHKGLDCVRLYTERQTLYCGRDNPLYGRAPAEVTPEDLKSAVFFGCDYPSQADLSWFQPHSEVKSMEALAMLLLSGNAIGYLPQHVAQRWVIDGSLWPICEEKLSFEADFSLLARKVAVQDPVQRAFAKLLTSMAADGSRPD